MSNNTFQVKAPYRFVPLSEKIVSPHWAHSVSHDIPFEDGHSGNIEITVTAMSDIFVSDGTKDERGVLKFCTHNDKYFIPSTSMKGMIRNVLEIMSFGGMKEKVQNDRYAFRDLSRADNEYLPHFKPNNVFCGYLYKNKDGHYFIKDCGFPGRISQRKIDAHFGTNMATFFDRGGGFSPQKDEQKSAHFKINRYKKVIEGTHRFNETVDNSTGKIICDFDEVGKYGKIVFTGQPGYNDLGGNKQRKGKHYEFVFFENNAGIEREVSSDVIKNFKFAYFDHDKTRWSRDWEERRKDLASEKEIPVFFQIKGGKVIHLGLSYLYKLPFNHSIYDVLEHTQKRDAVDLAETIFGNIRDNNNPLKSRVNISNGWAEGTVQELDKRSEVLSSPKASFFPFYLKQNGRELLSYMSDSAELAGWKRYPVHRSIKRNSAPNENTKILVHFKPLASGVEFKFKLRYHNLRKIELGAILSALTFHNTDGLFHSIGMAKPLGYGKVKVAVQTEYDDITPFLRDFENYMNASLKYAEPKWHESEQIKELFAMSMESDKMEKDSPYMELKGFIDVKKNKAYLPDYSSDLNIEVKSYSTPQSINQIKEWLESDKVKMESSGEIASIVHAFQTREEASLKQFFATKKMELFGELNKAFEQKAKLAFDAANSIETYEAFCQNFPNSELVPQAKELIIKLRQQANQQAAADAREADLIFESYDFANVKDYLNGFFKQYKNFQFSEGQKTQIIEAMKKSWDVEHQKSENNNAFYKKKKLLLFPKFPWSDVVKWLGKANAEDLFNQLNSK